MTGFFLGSNHFKIFFTFVSEVAVQPKVRVEQRDGFYVAGMVLQTSDTVSSIAQQPAQLGLRGDLGRHQIQQNDLQRTDILGQRPVLGHDKDILFLQGFCRRQTVGNFNRHPQFPPL